MSFFANYSLAVFDGALHIRCEQAAYSTPELVSCYWPVAGRPRDVADYLGCEIDQLPACKVTQSRPGEYYARNPNTGGPVGVHLPLTHGGATKSVKATSRPYSPPKTRVEVEYRDGHWWKNLKSGWTRVD